MTHSVQVTSERKQCLFFYHTDEYDVFHTFIGIQNSKCCDVNDIQMKPVKQVLHILAPSLSHIYNLSISSGTFPRQMQFARAIVLFKNGDKNYKSNNRPFSILPVFSKCLEKIYTVESPCSAIVSLFLYLHNTVFEKDDQVNLPYYHQKGIILKSFEDKINTLGIFVDFSKAFERINHLILLKRLELYGFRGITVGLIASYLKFANSVLSSITSIQVYDH